MSLNERIAALRPDPVAVPWPNEIANEGAVQAPTLVTIGAAELAEPIPDIPWIVPGLKIGPGRPTMIAGYAYSAKTLLAQEIAFCVAAGKRVFGLYQCKRGRVLHIDYEMGRRLLARRYQRFAAAFETDLAGLGEGDWLRVVCHPENFLDDQTFESVLAEECKGYSLVVIDSFTASLRGLEENSAEAARPLYMLGRVSEMTGATFLVLHHARKPSANQQGGAKTSIRGSSAIFGACDSVFVLSAEKGEPVSVTHEKSPTDGEHVGDFSIRVDDVEVDGDRKGGIRLSHLDKEQLPPTPNPHQALKGRILRHLEAHPDTAGLAALHGEMGTQRTATSTALNALLGEGLVVNAGTKQCPKLRLGAVPR